MSQCASLSIGSIARSGWNLQKHLLPKDEIIRSAALTLGWRGRILSQQPPSALGRREAMVADTYPCHVADAEYSVDDVLIDVCRDKLHLDGPVAPGGLLGPVLHTELGKERGHREGPRMGVGALASFIPETSCCLQDTLARKAGYYVGDQRPLEQLPFFWSLKSQSSEHRNTHLKHLCSADFKPFVRLAGPRFSQCKLERIIPTLKHYC